MNLEHTIDGFAQLGDLIIRELDAKKLDPILSSAYHHNPWFNEQFSILALSNIANHLLRKDKLSTWLEMYHHNAAPNSKKVAIIMAGNIPLVGWHDLMCVLLSGHEAQIKLSSKDEILPKYLIEKLIELLPDLKSKIHIAERLSSFDAVIATGSSNTSRYFDYYFGKYPHIIRKNRSSVAILNGNETNHQLYLLGKDIFSYYGLGCRNVNKIYVPASFDFTNMLDNFQSYAAEVDFNKYDNNYTYQKSIMLINKIPHLDNGFLLVKEDQNIASAVSVLHYEKYNNLEELKANLERDKEAIQCIVGDSHHGIANVPFGQSQSPELWDYPDGVDTFKFLLSL